MKNSDCICQNISQNENSTLLFAGQDTTALANAYGTPLYLMDEDRIRELCRTYRRGVQKGFGDNAKVYYASKAASFKQMYRIMMEEGLGVDVVSAGEIHTAVSVGFPMEKACFHSNNKTEADIIYAMDCGVGTFVIDNEEELYDINRLAEERGFAQRVLIRITPGIDTHTYEAINTGKVDSKFGFAIETGQGAAITKLALSLPHINLVGFHSHVGSQVFDSDIYIRTADIMLQFVADMQQTFGFVTKELDMGGGYGVRYTAKDPYLDIEENLVQVGTFMKQKAEELGIALPTISFEPGRSIVADAGMTLYTVGTVKTIPGYKTYVSVDGGMTDNIRYALYGAEYTLLPCRNLDEERDMLCSVVGRCCESGDIIQENIHLPASIKRGDLLACLTTGAYHYSMASNYNRLPRPPIVMLRDGKATIAVRRETVQDVCALDE